MNKILSINYKFFKLPAKELLSLITKYNKENIIQGFEFSVETLDEMEYIKEFIKNADKKYIFNLHAPTYNNIGKYYEYLKFAKSISLISRKKINIVLHPLYAKDEYESINKTKSILYKIFEEIDKKHYDNYLDISIENLNNLNGIKRLKKENFISLFVELKNLKFTYDIGHEIADGMENKELDDIFIERMNNIHIHAYNKILKEDHHPIYNINEEITTKELLKKYVKNQNVVLEYAIDYIEGNNFEQKLKNYIESTKQILV